MWLPAIATSRDRYLRFHPLTAIEEPRSLRVNDVRRVL